MFDLLPRRGPIRTALGFGSFAVWGISLFLLVFVISKLPFWKPGITGCHFFSSLITSIRCQGVPAAGAEELVLNLAFYWTAGLGWMVLFPPFIVLWAFSLLAMADIIFSKPRVRPEPDLPS